MSTNKIIGKSKSIKCLLSEIDIVAKSNASILISGETGTGKELIAKRIHDNSKRNNKPFIAINLASLNDQLIESQLFGHKKGSFTGAINEYKGLLRLAEGGTLFLDEIGDISPTIQVKLLRVLQENEVWPVGADKPVTIDVRIIAATHRDLWQMVSKNKFREDLFYRLNIFPIFAPSLRDREEDIWELFNYFINVYLEKENKTGIKIDPILKNKLMEWHWPGNVREIQNIAYATVIRTSGSVISPSNLPPTFKAGSMAETIQRQIALNNIEITNENISNKERDEDLSSVENSHTLNYKNHESFCSPTNEKKERFENFVEFENKLKTRAQDIIITLKNVKGNKAKAAKILNMSRSTLYRKIQSIKTKEENSIFENKPIVEQAAS